MPTASPSLAAIAFPPFLLDRRAGLLRRDQAPLNLRPKTYAVLLHLAERPGELVTKRALLDAVWPGAAVTEDVVRQSVGELRDALGDDRAAPRFIATVPRRGYRFIARLTDEDGPPEAADPAGAASEPECDAERTIVGRDRERATIADWLRAASSGRRQVAFVAGEAGIGKTTLVDMVLDDLRRAPGAACRIARGQCIEHFGGGEPYLPVLDALAELCRGGDDDVRATLGKHAPDWVLRALGRDASGADATPPTTASTHDHTLHMLAASLDALAVEIPLVLVLEDLQWSDYATLDLVSVIAQRRDPARLLILCTLRSADAIVSGHPVADVKRELLRKGLCRQILLDGLTADDVATYLDARLPAARIDAAELPGLLVDRTNGNPFFLVTLVDHLLERGLLADNAGRPEIHDRVDALHTAIPEGLRAVIEPRLERLTPDELRVFEAASVVGSEFAAHAVARVAPADSDLADVEVVEQLCDGLVRRQEILRAAGESTWPDGTTSARYAFRHALYRQVAYRAIPPSALRRLHQSVGEGLEAAWAGRTKEVASELAAHFDRSRDVERAIRYHGQAARHAGARFAYQESRLHLQAALEHLQSQPETPARLQRELPVLTQLGWTHVAIHSWGDPEAFRSFTRARDLAERLAVPALRLRTLESLRTMHTMRADYATTKALAEETMVLAKQLEDGMAVAAAHVDLGSALVHLGEYETARSHAERARALVDDASMTAISARVLLAGTCVHLGRVAQLRSAVEEARACASRIGIPYFSAFWATYGASTFLLLRDVERTRDSAEHGLRLAGENGFASVQMKARMLLGWCDVEEGRVEEGRAAVRAGYAAFLESGERTSTTAWQVILIEAHLACGDVARANEVLDAAFAFCAETGERMVEHELHRLRGECLLADMALRDGAARATAQFERAVAIAAERGALLFELRAATSLLRLDAESARGRVSGLLGRFDAANECFDTSVARALLRA